MTTLQYKIFSKTEILVSIEITIITTMYFRNRYLERHTLIWSSLNDSNTTTSGILLIWASRRSASNIHLSAGVRCARPSLSGGGPLSSPPLQVTQRIAALSLPPGLLASSYSLGTTSCPPNCEQAEIEPAIFFFANNKYPMSFYSSRTFSSFHVSLLFSSLSFFLSSFHSITSFLLSFIIYLTFFRFSLYFHLVYFLFSFFSFFYYFYYFNIYIFKIEDRCVMQCFKLHFENRR